MAHFKRKGTARRHRSVMYAGIYGGNGRHRLTGRDLDTRREAGDDMAEASSRKAG